MTQLVCGVDVSSRLLEASIGPDGPSASFPNTVAGISSLASFCREHETGLVAMEATGGYERHAWSLLSAMGLGVAVLNPRSVRQFATGMGRLEKTDRIDAAMIAWFAQVKRVRPLAPPTVEHQQLRSLSTRLRQLTQLRTAQLNQRRLVEDAQVKSTFDQLLALLKQQIDELAHAIAQLIQADPLWRDLDQAFRCLRGVADRTVARVMAEMPEIGTLSHKSISKLAGLAPIANESGKHQGKRPIRGGRSTVREILFMAASVSGRYEPDFIAFKQKLAEKGKPPKVVRIALAHKLLVRLNAKARDIRKLHLNQTTA